MKVRHKRFGRFIGHGMLLAFEEHEEIWRDKKCRRVKFPSDRLSLDERKSLHGEVYTYKLTKEEIEKLYK